MLRRLRADWTTALGLLVACLATGCGGGGAPVDPGDVTPEARLEAMDAVAAALGSLPPGASTADKLAAATTAMDARPEFERTGSSLEWGSAWGLFHGGTLYIVDAVGRPATQPLPEAEASARQGVPARHGVPAGPAVLCQVLPTSHYANLSARISPWLTAAGYSVTADPTRGGGVDSLRYVQAAGLFYMGAHGVVAWLGEGNGDVWAAATATTPSLSLDRLYAEDLADRSLVIVEGYPVEGPIRRYGITAGFVRKYMGFAPNSLVYMDACSSDSTAAAPFKQACFDKGASLYAGWSRVVTDAACAESTPFLLARMLSMPAPDGEDQGPPRRPFDHAGAYSELKLRGWDVDDRYTASQGSVLAVTEGPGSGAFLRPSIECLRVDEHPDGASAGQSELVVRGSFGSDPGEGPFHAARNVRCGGEELSIVTWAPEEIHATLPVNGPGSAGDVVVTVQGLTSNVVPLTEWWVTVTYSTQAAPGSGETVYTEIATNCHLRYDIHGWRETPTGAPAFALPEHLDPPTGFAVDSYGSFECGGERPVHNPETGAFSYKVVYSGSGSLPYLASSLGNGCWGSSRLHYEYTGGESDAGGPAPALFLRCAVAAEGYPFRSHILWADGTMSNEETHRGSTGPLEFDLVIGDGGAIEAGESGRLSWQRTLPLHQPTEATPRAHVPGV